MGGKTLEIEFFTVFYSSRFTVSLSVTDICESKLGADIGTANPIYAVDGIILRLDSGHHIGSGNETNEQRRTTISI